MSRKRINALTDRERARMDGWADRWIEVGLRTGAADKTRFVEGARACYAAAGLPFPSRVVWVQSPLVLALAAPTADYLLGAVSGAVSGAVNRAVDGAVSGAVDGAVHRAVTGAVRDAVDGAVNRAVSGAVNRAVNDAVHRAVSDAVNRAVNGAVSGAVSGAVNRAVSDAVHRAVSGAVGGAVTGAVSGAVRDAVDGAVNDAVDGAVSDAVTGAVSDAVSDAVDGAVHGAVDGAVSGAVSGAVDGAVRDAVGRHIAAGWRRYLGGQFWVGGGYWGSAYVSFFRDVMDLALPSGLWDRARAYEATVESACWWWPHRDFIVVCERPTAIHRELVGPDVPRWRGSHHLHRDDGPAIAWPDGWGIYAIHGVRVPERVVMAPHTLTPAEILAEPNQEVRRIMIARFGADRLLREGNATELDASDYGTLWQLDVPDDEPIVMVQVENKTPEPDGTSKHYYLRVPPTTARAREAVAWTFGVPESEYQSLAES